MLKFNPDFAEAVRPSPHHAFYNSYISMPLSDVSLSNPLVVSPAVWSFLCP